MDPLSAMLSGGMGAVSSLIGDQMQSQSQTATNNNNYQMMLDTQQFDQTMSDTAYQRGTNDMKAAGLNPALMYGSGGAASSPTVSAPTMGNPGAAFGNLGGQMTSALQSGLSAASTAADVGLKASQQKATDISAGLDPLRAEATIGAQNAQSAASYAGANASRSSAQLANTQNQQAQADLQKAKVQGRAWKSVNDYLDTSSSAFQNFKSSVPGLSNNPLDVQKGNPATSDWWTKP